MAGGQNLPQHLPLEISERGVPSGIAVRHLLVVEPESVQDRGTVWHAGDWPVRWAFDLVEAGGQGLQPCLEERLPLRA